MVDDNTISYDDSEDSTSQQSTPQNTGNEPSQQSTGSGQGQAPAGQNTNDEQEEPEQQAPQQGTAQNNIVEEETPVPDESNMVKQTPKEAVSEAGEAVSEAAENAYEKAMNVGEKGAQKAANMRIVAAAVVVVAIIAAAFFLFRGSGNTGASTITYTTTVKINYQLNSCGTISSPGKYTVHSSIFTRIGSGACIVINSSNVTLTGSDVQLTGNGPFIDTPPYTYGILVENASYVSVRGFNVTRFSYGIYFENSSHISISNSSVGNATMSDISISNAPYTSVSNDIVYGASSPAGAILIGTGSNGTSITNSIVEFNAYYGTATYSPNTLFYGDNFLGNQVDLYCGAGIPAYSSSGSFANSKCNFNRQCNFATCIKSNYDFSPSYYNLSNQVSTCGAFVYPGNYVLTSNLDLANYMNTSRNEGACLTVLTAGVKLNCNGKSIMNAYYGVYGSRAFNFTMENCNFSNDTYGTFFNSSAVLKFSNLRYSKGTYGIYLNNVQFANITNSSYYDNTYGTYLRNSTVGIYGVKAENNTYGLATDGSTGGVLYNGSLIRNKVDLYCSANSYNRSGFTMSGVSCSSSDCGWATGICTTKVLPPLAAFPVNSCTVLSVAGNYSLNTNLISKSTCMKFEASNISLNCNGHLLNYDGSSQTASAFYASRVSNITLINCNTENFPYGFSAYNSSKVLLGNSTFSHPHAAVYLYNISLSIFNRLKAYNYSVYGLYAGKLEQSSVSNSTAYSLSNNATGFSLADNSMHNIFVNNTASNNRNAGFAFDSSNNNLVANNTGNSNARDYVCNSASSGIYAELNGVNIGLTKTGCTWLVELPVSTYRPTCAAINTVNKMHITQDMLFTYGTTCFSIYNSNKSTLTDGSYINCEGHTIYASKGGIFANIYNTSNIKIENCFLKNFTQAVVSSAKYTGVINSTIANSANAVVLNGANSSTINDVSIFNASNYAILLNKSAYVAISNVNIRNSSTGIQFNSATLSTLSSSSVYGTVAGIACSSGSQTTNRDLGGNACSTTDCSWLTSSSCKA